VHEDGECNPDMLVNEISEEELAALEAKVAESDVVSLDDHNRSILEALKEQMEK
jgi:hypothetical protein